MPAPVTVPTPPHARTRRNQEDPFRPPHLVRHAGPPAARSHPGAWQVARVGGAPVVISPTSALLALLLAASWWPVLSAATASEGMSMTIAVMAATIVGTGVSVSLHELAHGGVGALLGRRPALFELYLWGGRTVFAPPTRPWGPWKDAVTSLAGPAANAALWLAGHQAVQAWSAQAPVAVGLSLWVLTWVNLALAVFNVLPALPLDGGHALAALVQAATGRPRTGQLVAGVSGLLVVAGLLWRWMLSPLAAGSRPEAMTLILVVMVVWPLATTSWRVLGLDAWWRRRTQAAQEGLDLEALAQPVAVVDPHTPLEAVEEILRGPTALVLVAHDAAVVGVIDAVSLRGARAQGADARTVGAGAVCEALSPAQVTTQHHGSQAAQALRRARAAGRWLVLVASDAREVTGAVPTGR